MTRSRRSAKKAGAEFERAIADYLAQHIDDRIDKRPRNGAKDRGDIGGVRLSPALGGGRVVIEAKNAPDRVDLAGWAAEAENERGNDDAAVGLTVHKRKNVQDPGRQWFSGTVDDLIALINGRRPEEES